MGIRQSAASNGRYLALLAPMLVGCSTAALNEPLDFAIACRPDAGLRLAGSTVAAGGTVDPVLAKVAELAILKDAGRTKSYDAALAKVMAEYPSVSADEMNQAIDSKVAEMRATREKATGSKTC